MPAAGSSLSNVTLRPELGASFMQFDLARSQQGFIGHDVLRVLEVQKAAGPFGKIKLAELLKKRETKRAPGTGYQRQQWKFDTDTFATDEHGAEEPVDDREAQMYASYFDAEQMAALRARDIVLRNAEDRIASAVINTTTWTGSSLATDVSSTPWATVATAVPLTNVEAAVQKVFDNSGMWPNALVISRKVFRNLRNTVQIIDRIKYSGLMDPLSGNITTQALAQAFDLPYILVGGEPKNTADEGQTASLSSLWSDSYAMVCRVAETDDIREPCIGRTFHWGADGSSIGGMVESYRDETVRSNIIRCRHDVQEKILYPEMGHLLKIA